MIDYTQLVSTTGFPIAITFYVLFRLEKAMKNNTDALVEIKAYLKNQR